MPAPRKVPSAGGDRSAPASDTASDSAGEIATGTGLPGLRRWLAFGVLFAGLSALGVWGIAATSTSTDAVRLVPAELVARLAAWPAIALLGALLAIYFVADGLRLHFALAALGHRLPWPSMAKLVFVNFFVSNLTPLATGGGVAQVWFLSRRGVPIGAATAATSLRTLMAAGMILGGAPIALLHLDHLRALPMVGPLLTAIAGVGLALTAILLVLLRRPAWLLGLGSGALDRAVGAGLVDRDRHARWRRRLRRETIHFVRSAAVYAGAGAGARSTATARAAPWHGQVRGQGPRQGQGVEAEAEPRAEPRAGTRTNTGGRRELALAGLSTFVFLAALFSFPPAILFALGHRPALIDWYGLMTLTTAAMYVAPTPGAAGIAEGVFGVLVTGVEGVSEASRPFITLVWRALTIHLGVVIGALVIGHEVGAWTRWIARS